MIEPEIQDIYFCVWQKRLERIPWGLHSHHSLLPCLAWIEDLMLGFQIFYSFWKGFCICCGSSMGGNYFCFRKVGGVFVLVFRVYCWCGVFFSPDNVFILHAQVFPCTFIFGCLLLFLPLSIGMGNSPKKQLIYLLQGVFEKTLAKAWI